MATTPCKTKNNNYYWFVLTFLTATWLFLTLLTIGSLVFSLSNWPPIV